MKKSLVFAMTILLGVASSTYAANPFTDVPAGHWAYDSITKLVTAGVIEGYGNNTFRGDRLLTRYEMAKIVAEAMAKGANIDKLAAEFANELSALGVRVAVLEKKIDNVKITGEVRYHYGDTKLKFRGGRKNKLSESGLRTRLYFTGKVNDKWNYVGRIENQQWFNDDIGNEGTAFNIAKLRGRLGGLKVVAGHDDDVCARGYIYDGEADGLKLSYGNKWYVSGAYGKLTSDMNNAGADFTKKFWNTEIGTRIKNSFVNGKIGYVTAKLGTDGTAFFNGDDSVGIWYAGADFNLAKDLAFNVTYLLSNRDRFVSRGVNYTSEKNGYVLGLAYKGAQASKPGSWGLSANYYHQGRATYLQHTIDGYTDFKSGFKGWSIGGKVAVAKNMILSATYYDTQALDSAVDDRFNGSKAKVIWSEFNVIF